MRSLCRIAVAAGMGLAALSPGCEPKSGSITFVNETDQTLELALLAPGVLDPFPPIRRAAGQPGGGPVTFRFDLAAEEVPAALIWKAGDYERELPITGSTDKKASWTIRIRPGTERVRSRPQEHVIDSHVLAALDRFQRVRAAWQSPTSETNGEVAGQWEAALESARQAQAAVQALQERLGRERDDAVQHAAKLVHNLALTIADGFVRVGERYETGSQWTRKDSVKAACYYVKADGLHCHRAGAKRRDLNRSAKRQFVELLNAHLKTDRVSQINRESVPGFTHRFTSVSFGGEGLHWQLEIKSIVYRDGERYTQTDHRSGTVRYAEDMYVGRYITLGGLAMKTESYRPWPGELLALWKTIAVLEGARRPEQELR